MGHGKWQILDLPDEAISTAHIFTELSGGTPGYRAPELMKDDSPGFNNEVDIWAMGCISFELATGGKPFGNDNAAGEYSRGGSEVEAHCDANIGIDMAKKNL
jgi:serine/threonine protein kinase